MMRHVPFLLLVLLALALQAGAADPLPAGQGEPGESALAAFADPEAVWGPGVEAVIEGAYRDCFRTFLVGGRFVTMRVPFGQNNERSELAGRDLGLRGGGKADPAGIWGDIEEAFASEDFRAYLEALSDGREKVIVFDLASGSWSATTDRFAVSRMSSGEYTGLPNRPRVLVDGSGPGAVDLYNYAYCVVRTGLDCSGFVFWVLRRLAAEGGLDLARALAGRTGSGPPASTVSYNVGTWFFDPRNRELVEVPDEIGRLRPGDVILFRDEEGLPLHTAVIQSIDLAAGRLRYLQSTDEAPQAQRGVHESFIRFDPSDPGLRLSDPALVWEQRRGPAFPGELVSSYRDDGERYRATTPLGGGTVVRLKLLEKPYAAILARAARAKAAAGAAGPSR